MVFIEPEEGVGNKVIPHFVSSVIEDQCSPLLVFALSGVGVFIETCSVEEPQSMAVFREAVGRFRPRLVWLSVSVEQAAEALRPELVKLSEDLSAHATSLVIGGQAVGRLADLRHPNLTIGHSMAELSTFARGLLASVRPHQESPAQDRKESP